MKTEYMLTEEQLHCCSLMISVHHAVFLLRGDLSGAEEDHARDSQLTEVIELLEHLETKMLSVCAEILPS